MAGNNKANFFKGATISLVSKPPENTPAPDVAPPAAAEEGTGSESKKDIFEDIKKMNATLQVVAKDVTTIKEATKELKDSVEEIKLRLGEAEHRILDMEDASMLTEATVDKSEKRLEVLWSRVEDL